MKLNIALMISALNSGGAERQLILLAGLLASRGHNVYIFTYGRGSLDTEVPKTVKLVTYKELGWFKVPQFLFFMKQHIRENNIHVVYSFLVAPNLKAALLKVLCPRLKVVWGLRAADMSTQQLVFRDEIYFLLSRFFSFLPNKVIANSRAGADFHSQKYFGLDIEVINNGVSADAFKPELSGAKDFRKAIGVEENTVLIGMVARLDPIKDIPMFLKAVALLKTKINFKVVVVGSGNNSYAKSLKEMSLELNLENEIIWLNSFKPISYAYTAFDVNVLVSKSEGFPNVVLESMCCGTPCIVASEAGDAPDMIQEDGWVLKGRNAQDLAELILKALEEKNKIDKFDLSKKTLTRFSTEKLLASTERCLLELSGSGEKLDKLS